MEKNKNKRRSGEKIRGSVSIMLAVLMLPVYTFAGAVADGARVYSAEQTASEAADLAANAALASYDDVLKNVYGLFAMSQDEDELSRNLYNYFNETVSCLPLGDDGSVSSLLGKAASYFSAPNSEYRDLIGLSTEYFSADPVESAVIAEPAVMKNQIVEYMKYIGPVSLGKGFLAKAGVLSDFKKHNKVVEAKIKYEESLSDIRDLCDSAYKSICSYNTLLGKSGLGDPDTVRACIESAAREYRASSLSAAESTASSLAADAFPADKELESEVKKDAKENETEVIEELSTRMQKYIPYKKEADGSIKGESSDFINTLREADSVSSNKAAFAYRVHSGIYGDYAEVHNIMELYEKYYKKLSDDERDIKKAEYEYFKAFSDAVNDQRTKAEDINTEWKGAAAYGRESGDAWLSPLRNNTSALVSHLENAVNMLDQIKEKVNESDADAQEWQDAISELSEGEVRSGMQSDLDSTSVSVNITEISRLRDALSADKDGVKALSLYLAGVSFDENTEDYFISDSVSASQAAEQLFSKCFHRPEGDVPSDFSETGPGYPFYDYLSKMCVNTVTDKKDSESVLNDLNESGSQSEINDHSDEVKGMNIGEHIDDDLFNEIMSCSSFGFRKKIRMSDPESSDTKDMLESQKKNMSEASSMLEDLAEIAKAAAAEGRDDLYLTEYITGMFSCRTSDKVCSGNTVSVTEPYSLSSIKMSESNNILYKGEVEYILWGNNDMQKNYEYTAAMLFGTRFLLNNIYAFTDREIKAAALAAAAAIAGWTGFGVPIVKTVIIMSLALAESVIDVNELLEGRSVVIYKSSSTWNMKPSGLKNALLNNTGQIAQMAADKAGKAVSDVFEKIEGIAADKTDELAGALHEMIGEAADQAAQTAENAVMGPVDDAVSQILETTDEVFSRERIHDLVEKKLDVVFTGGDDITSSVTGFMKEQILLKTDDIADVIYSGYSEAAGNGQEAVEKVREKISGEIENIISPVRQKADEYADKISSDLKNKVTEGINAAGDRAKEYASDMASKFITGSAGALSSDAAGTGSSVSLAGKDSTAAGKTVTLNYREYLKLFVMMNTFSETKENNMLSRMAVLMQINLTEGMNDTGTIRSKSSGFDITKAYTMIKVDADVKLNMWFTGMFVPDSVTGPDGKTEYSYDYSLFGTDEKNISVHSVMSY